MQLSDTPLVTRINVTPIIDVALVLVIILLITAPILSVIDLGVNLPQARTRGAEDERNLSITLSKEGQLAIGEDLVSPALFIAELQSRLHEAGAENTLVIIRADQMTSHATVKQLLKEVRRAGAQRIGIATRQKERGRR